MVYEYIHLRISISLLAHTYECNPIICRALWRAQSSTVFTLMCSALTCYEQILVIKHLSCVMHILTYVEVVWYRWHSVLLRSYFNYKQLVCARVTCDLMRPVQFVPETCVRPVYVLSWCCVTRQCVVASLLATSAHANSSLFVCAPNQFVDKSRQSVSTFMFISSSLLRL